MNMTMTSAPAQEDTRVAPALPVYRHSFTPDITEKLRCFSVMHKDLDRKAFQLAWQNWVDEHTAEVAEEVARMHTQGFTGDVVDKMYKSARYYYRKRAARLPAPQLPAEAKKQKQTQHAKFALKNKERGAYQMLLRAIKRHLEMVQMKPKAGFESFCRTHAGLLREIITNTVKTPAELYDFNQQLKKSFKNQYYTLIHAQSTARNIHVKPELCCK
jgi:hypothetical protein